MNQQTNKQSNNQLSSFECLLNEKSQYITIKGITFTKVCKGALLTILIAIILSWAIPFVVMILENSQEAAESLSGGIFATLIMLTIFIVIPICLITIVADLLIQCGNSNNEIDRILSRCGKLTLLNPDIIINTRNLQQYNQFDIDKLIYYLVDNQGKLEVSCNAINKNMQYINDLQTSLLRFLDYAISNNTSIYKRDISSIRKICTFMNSPFVQNNLIISVRVIYRSPAGRNYYEKVLNLNSENIDYIIEAMNNILQEEKIKYEQKQQKQTEKKTKKNTATRELELTKALALYMLEIPFSKAELKAQRNRLIKSFHPDSNNGTNASYAIKINDSYELLLKYAVD